MALEVNAGLVYDTRDIEAAPNRGIWAEAYLNGNVLDHRYLKACVYFRHYIDIPIHIPAGDPVFAYRLAWQQTIAGETPFYMIQNKKRWKTKTIYRMADAELFLHVEIYPQRNVKGYAQPMKFPVFVRDYGLVMNTIDPPKFIRTGEVTLLKTKMQISK